MIRIGTHLIETDWMTAEDVTTLITELRDIRKRKAKMEEFQERFETLLKEMHEEKMYFAEDGTGYVLSAIDWTLVDEKA